MTHLSHPTALAPLPAGELARLHDRAREDAEALRAEAMDDFWRGANAAFAATLDTAQRSAQRLAHRLARRERAARRGTVGACGNGMPRLRQAQPERGVIGLESAISRQAK
ncbi:MAG: hypothetical protein CVU30_10760 [Betaproteobacteria bacterium HGW-Betaproteobacteria-3]|nr:MAG: hypothetical protein CVU30_10760 [Betaproteobacteria bacterium HGW-Betaproteobacteria-3]